MHKHHIQSISKLIMLLFVYFIFIGTPYAASKIEIDIKVSASLDKFKEEIMGAEKFLEKA